MTIRAVIFDLGGVLVRTEDFGPREDLARRLGVAPAGIDVIEIERAEWPDTSLGCGEPGLARLPVAIAGYRIVLLAEAREYVYHTGRESGVVYCAKG